MSAHSSFAIDRPRGLIRIAMSGLFHSQDVADFLFARRRAHAELGPVPGGHLTLNDVRAMKIQPQQTVAAFHDLLANPEFPSRRLAFVVAPTLARGQLARAIDARTARCFPSMEEAEAWLFDGKSEAIVLPCRRAAWAPSKA